MFYHKDKDKWVALVLISWLWMVGASAASKALKTYNPKITQYNFIEVRIQHFNLNFSGSCHSYKKNVFKTNDKKAK